jgi:hypothetical protein
MIKLDSNAKIMDIIFNRLDVSDMADENQLRVIKRLNSLLYLGVSLLLVAGIVFFVSVYSFPK